MREIPKYASNKPFLEMSITEKLGLLGKLLIFVLTMGFAYPRLISYWGQGLPSKKVETEPNTAAPAH
jgi:hypothetical protein